MREEDLSDIRHHTRTGRPLGDETFLARLEGMVGRALKPQKRGQTKREGELSYVSPEFLSIFIRRRSTHRFRRRRSIPTRPTCSRRAADGDWSITSGTDHTSTTYDLEGETLTSTDERGVTHAYTYNSDGQVAADTVTSFGDLPSDRPDGQRDRHRL